MFNDLEQTQAPDSPGAAALHLTVIGPTESKHVDLPPNGTFLVGRARATDLRLNDPLVSRRHVVIHLGPPVTVEDLGSRNGTRFRGQQMAPHTQLEAEAGDSIHVGSHTLVLRRGAPSVSRRVGDFSYLRARVEEECARGKRGESPFALLAVRVLTGSIAVGIESLGAQLRPSDTLARLALPSSFAALLPGPSPAEGTAILERVAQHLKHIGQRVRTALVCSPADGQDATVLLTRLTDILVVGPADAASDEREPIRGAEMQHIHAALDRIAPAAISVLILGETGSGKDVIAEQIHRMSPRHAQPFLRLNCGALTETLLESELFGHERGAFTGATSSKPGLLESAQGGTVFLDEIGEMPLHLQVKLLQVLETRQVLRVGGLRPRPIDVRFLSATNRDLHSEVARGRFRQDLLFRLEGFTVRVPPLRERPSEIVPLARQFLQQAAKEAGRAAPAISAEAERALLAQTWPGNVRELRNTIERAVLLCDDVIEPAQLMRQQAGEPAQLGSQDEERRRIVEALELAAGNQTRAARSLGMARSTFVLKLNAHGIPRPRK